MPGMSIRRSLRTVSDGARAPMIFSSAVLPLPEGPRTTTNSPSRYMQLHLVQRPNLDGANLVVLRHSHQVYQGSSPLKHARVTFRVSLHHLHYWGARMKSRSDLG